jgi:hypothetical protein
VPHWVGLGPSSALSAAASQSLSSRMIRVKGGVQANAVGVGVVLAVGVGVGVGV